MTEQKQEPKKDAADMNARQIIVLKNMASEAIALMNQDLIPINAENAYIQLKRFINDAMPYMDKDGAERVLEKLDTFARYMGLYSLHPNQRNPQLGNDYLKMKIVALADGIYRLVQDDTKFRKWLLSLQDTTSV